MVNPGLEPARRKLTSESTQNAGSFSPVALRPMIVVLCAGVCSAAAAESMTGFDAADLVTTVMAAAERQGLAEAEPIGALDGIPMHRIVVPTVSSIRDLQMDRDTVGITLDTSGEGKFAYWFTLALGDSVQDGKVLPERNYSLDWDGPWVGRTVRRDDGWSAEMFFPWSMMSLPAVDGLRTIGFALSRQVSHENVRYQWPGHAYSSPQFVTALNRMVVGRVEPRRELSAVPYAAYTADRVYDDDDRRIGVDLTWKPSPAAEFAATLLPDFGAVEVDAVVLNLTAHGQSVHPAGTLPLGDRPADGSVSGLQPQQRAAQPGGRQLRRPAERRLS
ncbi:MAG: hypothetical protein ACNA7W_07530 [Pseudomonadales bacterium]